MTILRQSDSIHVLVWIHYALLEIQCNRDFSILFAVSILWTLTPFFQLYIEFQFRGWRAAVYPEKPAAQRLDNLRNAALQSKMSFMPGPTKVTGVHRRTSTVTGNQCDMMDKMDKIMQIGDTRGTAMMIHQHPMDLSPHPVECTVRN
jgi:hypothetical protein